MALTLEVGDAAVRLDPGKYTLSVWAADWTDTTVAAEVAIDGTEANSFSDVAGLSDITANAIVRDYSGGVWIKLTGSEGPVLDIVQQQ